MLKYLEGINFYGPYFLYCYCGNKNLEFYKNLEQKQFLQIIQQIKKSKRKNVVLSDNKNKKIKNKRKVKEHLDKDDNDSYDIQVNNNYSESMINQFSSNNSKKD